jgi:long-chain acyl-CoA synthetase
MHLSGAYVGYTIAFLADPLRTADALLEVRPTVLPSVPRVYEKVHTAVVSAIDEQQGARRRLAEWSLRVGREAGSREEAGRRVPRVLAVQRRLADRLVFAKVRERLGGRLRTPISGGAPLGRDVAEFFDAIGIRIYEGYGLSECTTAATTNTPAGWRLGTVGRALPGFELRTAEDGELLIRSETVFAGYLKDEEATALVLDAEGWLHTGDIAEIDGDGFVAITDRKKDILVTAGGKNIAPQNLENDLKASKYVSQAIVVGDRRPYPAALITLDEAEIAKWAAERGIEGGVEALARDEQVIALVQGIVDDVNRERSNYEQIKKFVILPRDFTMDDDEVTPTLKLKRRAIMRNFAETVESIYG